MKSYDHSMCMLEYRMLLLLFMTLFAIYEVSNDFLLSQYCALLFLFILDITVFVIKVSEINN